MNSVPLSDLELARLESPGKPDAQLVIELAQRTLDELAMEPPVSHEIIASMRDIARIEETGLPWAGCLVRDGGRFVIKLRASDSRGRKRFTAFHEVKHTYMPGFALAPRYRCDPAAPPDVVRDRDPSLEALCDLGAVELLLPRKNFLNDLDGNTPTLTLASQLAERYDASLEATARRIVTLRPAPTLLIALEPSCKPSAPHDEPKLRVKRAYGNADWPFIPRNKSVPPGSILTGPLSGEAVNEVSTLTGLTATPIGPVHISADLYPYTDDKGDQHMRVLALITSVRQSRQHHHAA
jgi:IrrE N-terminal-like domain